eukprot:m.20206 g.20206  ORF g.20206 m.20206 type:complete len:1173 (+) comp8834_c0_seq1:418-3936(+)
MRGEKRRLLAMDKALIQASLAGDFKQAKLAAAEGARVNRRWRDLFLDGNLDAWLFNWTPLHCASHAGHLEIVRLLLLRGAAVHVRDTKERSPADLAQGNGHDAIVQLLRPSKIQTPVSPPPAVRPHGSGVLLQIANKVRALAIQDGTTSKTMQPGADGGEMKPSQLQSKVARLETELRALQQHLNQASQQQTTERRQAADLLARHQTLQAEHQALQKGYSRLQLQMSETVSNLEAVAQENRMLKLTNDLLKVQVDDLQRKAMEEATNLKQEIAKLQAQLETCNSDGRAPPNLRNMRTSPNNATSRSTTPTSSMDATYRLRQDIAKLRAQLLSSSAITLSDLEPRKRSNSMTSTGDDTKLSTTGPVTSQPKQANPETSHPTRRRRSLSNESIRLPNLPQRMIEGLQEPASILTVGRNNSKPTKSQEEKQSISDKPKGRRPTTLKSSSDLILSGPPRVDDRQERVDMRNVSTASTAQATSPAGDSRGRHATWCTSRSKQESSFNSDQDHFRQTCLELDEAMPSKSSATAHVSPQSPEGMQKFDLDISQLSDQSPLMSGEGLQVKGTFGKVYKAKLSGQSVAIKVAATSVYVTAKSLESSAMAADTTARQEQQRLLSHLISLRHPNLLNFLGVCYQAKGSWYERYLVFSWIDGGSLYDYLHIRKLSLSKRKQLGVLTDVAKGMDYLHAHNVTHRRLKSSNILLMVNLTALICDFGIEPLHGDTEAETFIQDQASYLWASPEALAGVVVNRDTDVFSFGVCAWETFFHRLPWQHLSPLRRSPSIYHQIDSQRYLPLNITCDHRKLTMSEKLLVSCCLKPAGHRADFQQLCAVLHVMQEAEVYSAQPSPAQLHKVLVNCDLGIPPPAFQQLENVNERFLPLEDCPDVQTVAIDISCEDGQHVTEKLLREAGGRTAQEPFENPFAHRIAGLVLVHNVAKDISFAGYIQRRLVLGDSWTTASIQPQATKIDSGCKSGDAKLDLAGKKVLAYVSMQGQLSPADIGGAASPYRVLNEELLAQRGVRVQRVFRGIRSLEAVDEILQGRFSVLELQESTWFGRGLYFTPDLDYALTQTCPCRANTSAIRLDTLNLSSSSRYRVVLVCDLVYGCPAPVTKSGERSPNCGNDAHVAVLELGQDEQFSPDIRLTEVPEALRDGKTVVAEIVVGDPSSVIVRAVLLF